MLSSRQIFIQIFLMVVFIEEVLKLSVYSLLNSRCMVEANHILVFFFEDDRPFNSVNWQETVLERKSKKQMIELPKAGDCSKFLKCGTAVIRKLISLPIASL